MTKKLIFFSLILFSVFGLIFFFNHINLSSHQTSHKPRKPALKMHSNVKPLNQFENKNQHDLNQEKNPPLQAQKKVQSLNAIEIAKINKWLRLQGFTYLGKIDQNPNPDGSMGIEEDSDYKYYDLETLKSMSINDPRALLELGIRYNKNDNIIMAKQYLEKAAVYGYFRALITMSDMYARQGKYAPQGSEQDPQNKNQQADENYINAYAWAYVTNLRFNPENKQLNITEGFLNNVGKNRLAVIKQQARIKAHKIYKKLKQKRFHLGLGKFDNYMPETLIQRWNNETNKD